MLVGCNHAIEIPSTLDFTPLLGDDWKVLTLAEKVLNPILAAKWYFNAAELETSMGR
jgi:hypothetical protein